MYISKENALQMANENNKTSADLFQRFSDRADYRLEDVVEWLNNNNTETETPLILSYRVTSYGYDIVDQTGDYLLMGATEKEFQTFIDTHKGTFQWK